MGPLTRVICATKRGRDRSGRRGARPPLLGAALVALACTGCPSRWAEFRIVEIHSGQVTSVDESGFDVKLRCRVENPNLIGAELHDLRFRSTAGPFELGAGRVAGFVKRVAGRSRFALEVPVRVAYARLPPDLPQRTAGRRLALRTEVWFTARTGVGSYEMHLVSEDRAAIAETIRAGIQGAFRGDALRIERITVHELGLRGMELELAAVARNLFPFPVAIRSARYELAINEQHFGRGELQRALRLAPRSRTRLALTVHATHGAVGRALLALATTDPRFRVRGAIAIEPIAGIAELPLDVTADSSVFAR